MAALLLSTIVPARSLSAAPTTTVDLRPYGLSTALDVKLGVFYVSKDRLALFFDQQLPATGPHSHSFQLIILNIEGQTAAQMTLRGDPNAIDITPGPDGGLLVGREGQLDFYDSRLQVERSITVSPATTGVRFDRERNQLVVMTLEQELGHRTAHFLSGDTLKESAALTYPIRSNAVFGENQLVYTVSGNCHGAAHITSDKVAWRPLDTIPACDPLTFISSDRLAYAFDGSLYTVDSSGKELLQARIPAPDTFEEPRFIGLSEDHARLALSALKKKTFSSGWPYHDEVFVYDLVSKRLIFKHALEPGYGAEALSPDGHQLAVISQGALLLIPLP